MSDFEYTTPEQQIKKLISQKLSFEDENQAKLILQTYGYYNIINGYRDPYITREYGEKKYHPDVTFEQIFSLFSLDHSIRDAVVLSMIDLEEHLRAVVADIVAESFGSDHNEYLKTNNYRDRKVKQPHFSRRFILDDLKKIAETSTKQPIKYYRENHKIVPPWILLKGIPFGTLVNFTRLLKGPQKDKLVCIFYGNKVTDKNIDIYKDLLADSLAMCYEYRNLAAHGGRIYNYIPKSNIRFFEKTDLHKGLPQLVNVLKQFEYNQPYRTLNKELIDALNIYCHSYPNDLYRIEQATGFSIYMQKKIWVNGKTHKYHSIQHCSGSQNCILISFDEAKKNGYIPCKKCCKTSD